MLGITWISLIMFPMIKVFYETFEIVNKMVSIEPHSATNWQDIILNG